MKLLLKNSFLLLFVCFGVTASLAQGDLMIYPKRLVFAGNQHSQDFTLANIGKDTSRYTISMINFRMTENGQFEEITTPDPGQHFADKHIRIFPRTVTLAPGESQKVKVQVYRANQLEEGEYRSHLFFQAVKDPKALGEDGLNENLNAKNNGISIKLEANFGISIPVIIEKGNPLANGELSNISLNQMGQGAPQLSFTIQRNGDRSVYGDFKVAHLAPSGVVTEVGSVKGVAVYTPIPQRHFSMVLNQIEGIDYSSGKLSIEYNPQDSKAQTLANGELLLN